MLNKVSFGLYFPAASIHSASSCIRGVIMVVKSKRIGDWRSEMRPFPFVYSSCVTEELTHGVSEIWWSLLLVYFEVKSPGYLPHSCWFIHPVFLFLRSLLSLSFHPASSSISLCFPLNIFAAGLTSSSLEPPLLPLCALAMLVPWLQGFPMCIYSVFIGAEPCFLSAYQQPPCTPPTNLPDTALGFQDTTGPGCSHSQLTRPWCLSSPSLICCFSLKCSQIPWFVSCWFFFFSFTTQLLLFLSFYRLSLHYFHFLGFLSLISQCSLSPKTSVDLRLPPSPSLPLSGFHQKRHENASLSSSVLVMCVLL